MDYQDKQIVIVGAGSTGRSLARFFLERGAQVVLSDCRLAECFDDLSQLNSLGVRLDLGGHTQALFEVADLVAVSPGVPLDIPVLSVCRDRDIAILGEVEIAWHELSGTMIAITGTNGKSTVTSLVGEMLKAWDQKVFIGGNLGVPLIEAVGKDYDWHVVELSSFQLETIDAFRPNYAMLLNISEDHLDRYPDMASYIAAKQRIFENQKEDDVAILNHDDPMVQSCTTEIVSRKVYFSSRSALDEGMSLVDDRIIWRCNGQETLFPVAELQIRGRHNQENVMAALMPLLLAGCPAEIAWGAAIKFTGLKHRMEYLGNLNGADWYNDSKGTNIGACVAALEGLDTADGSLTVLIAGGDCKGADFSELAPALSTYVRTLVLIGRDAPGIARAVGGSVETVMANDLVDAVRQCRVHARPGDRVLLSPACASFDMFRNYLDRGEQFMQAVRSLQS